VKPSLRIFILSSIIVSILAVAAVSWHSVEEIHYLKSFYPKQFTVEEAFYASGVELIKVLLVGLPVFLAVGAGLWLLRHFNR
jgi:hypothetical protein